MRNVSSNFERTSVRESFLRSAEPQDAARIGYEVLNNLSDITAISSEWNDLLARISCNRAFSSAQWFTATCRLHLEMMPHVIVARRAANLVAILPLVLTDEGRCAEFPSYISDYNDILAAPEETEAVCGLLDYAAASARGCHSIKLTNLRDDSNCLRALRMMETARSFNYSLHQERSCFYLRLSSNYDELLRTKSRVFRKNLWRAEREAERAGVIVRELEPESFSADELPELFLSLNFERFGNNSHFESARAQAFIQEVFPSLFVERRFRAFALYQAQRIIGIDICMVGSRSLCTWNGGFIPTAERFSPGMLLINAGIRQAYALQMDEYDFLRGTHAYKARWANGTRVLSRCEFQLT
jgi:CelD/BcsL family acetyltransferase involved in cellulose biosynthesis